MNDMQGYNVIWIFSPTADKALFCKRRKEPYKGLYNLVGGKIEPCEDGLAAAYRELREETSITDIELAHLMDFTYFLRDACRVEVYVGKLAVAVEVHGDEKELVWLDVNEDFFDMRRFAGEGNIGHIYEIIKQNLEVLRCGARSTPGTVLFVSTDPLRYHRIQPWQDMQERKAISELAMRCRRA